jgi:uncharacterized protein YijF (DUF1287 family)
MKSNTIYNLVLASILGALIFSGYYIITGKLDYNKSDKVVFVQKVKSKPVVYSPENNNLHTGKEQYVDYQGEKEPTNLLEHILWQTTQDVTYDPRYYVIKYPMGDVPANKGVCVDVPIRALRTEGIDLQQLVHQDIKLNLSAYGLSKADSNIDHRRCVNLIKYFKRHNNTIPVTNVGSDYRPGDLVFWNIARGHVGVVSDIRVPGTNRYFIVHNICCGPKLEDMLFAAEIVAHVRLNLKSLN